MRDAANEGLISAQAGHVTVGTIRTGEELMIARPVCRVLGFTI
jgi:acetate kinase